MRVTFVLPGFRSRPVGGFLVVYHYANELVRCGYDVAIVHPRRAEPATAYSERVKAASWRVRKAMRYGGRPPWFPLDEAVRTTLVRDLADESKIPPGDAIFATSCHTAAPVLRYGRERGAKLYLIQGYEDWSCDKATVDASWKMPFHKVVSSRWLYEIGLEMGQQETMTHIPYGMEFDSFYVRKAPSQRKPARIGFLAHSWRVKGLPYAIDAVTRVKAQLPSLDSVAFGAGNRPDELPEWIDYVENPSREELALLYNSLAIFLHSSLSEGWPLPPAEALACGCALVASDSGGVRDYAIHDRTAVVVPPGDAEALAEGIFRLIQDTSLRCRLATNGAEQIRSFTWKRAATRIAEVIQDRCSTAALAS